MEFVGRKVKKDFKGFGVFTGEVKSYDSSAGFFEIGYEDGDSEEIDFSELASLLNEDGIVGDHSRYQFDENNPSRVEREPKKRRIVLGIPNSGNHNDSTNCRANSLISNKSSSNSVVKAKLRDVVENLNKNVNFSNSGDKNIVGSNCENVNLNDCSLDLNCELNDCDNNARGNDEGIDLNLNLNEERDEGESKQKGLVDSSVKKELCFDLNMELDDDESKNQDVDIGGYLKRSNGESQKRDSREHGRSQIEGASLDAKVVNNRNSSENHTNDVHVSGASPAHDYECITRSTHTGKKRGRKRKNLSDSVNAAAESVLRRSSRRRANSIAEDHVANALKDEDADSALLSPDISVVSEDPPTVFVCEEYEENVENEERNILPLKLELPPSSGNLNLDGVPALDLFSVYAFLRSFSTLLFLSPFGLGDFTASLKSKSPNLLIDYIHVSLLQILRKHLEFQSDESSPSATNCLRDLNWDLLDIISWPMFMVEYLLMKPGFDLCHLKLCKTDYYKQPTFVKVEILHYLCDDVIEAEVIRSELNRRTLVGEPTTKLVEVTDQNGDWNSDECCLCKMDGNLICCDGCPAAFHSKCVGIATDLLPEGDWYCPECVVDRVSPGMNVAKSIRGAELLGVDPHGRLYYSSCSYLLVSDPCDAESSFHYYHMTDLTAVVEALKLSNGPYRKILSAITKHSKFYKNLYATKSDMLENIPLCLEPLVNGQMPTIPVAPVSLESSETCVRNETLTEEKPGEQCMLSTYSSKVGCDVSNSANVDPLAANLAKIERPFAHCDGSADISQAVASIHKYLKNNLDYSKRSAEVVGNPSLTPSNFDSSNDDCDLSNMSARRSKPQQSITSYINVYSFARVASSVAKGWTRKPSNKISQEPTKSLEELISVQMKVISNTSADFCWSNIQNLNVDARKEKCGWCLACKFPTDDVDCLFVTNNTTILESFTSELLGLSLRRNMKDRLVDVMCHILCIEDRLHGLLLGPWLNPHFPKLYRNSFHGASDIVPVKYLLLMLESNLWIRALSAEWLKHVDSVVTVGSASHISLRVPSRNARKRSRHLDLEPHSLRNANSGLSQFWWRGGKLTRQLFSWKSLPRSLASKAARQGGGKKIQGILYLENSDFAKRSKSLAWRASVESSVTAEQLALQVRELDANIRWNEIENTDYLSKMDKETMKSVRSYKKVIIRRKSSEGGVVKYLLDFGKRRFIPDTVVKNGSKLQEPSSERKKYWLEEPYVPLFLLKGFEERKIALKSSKKSSDNLSVMKKPLKNVGFSYLFSKAERSENHQCGHCNKDVLTREGVSCQYCEGFFHKRHVRKTSGAVTTKCKFTCHECHARGGKLKVDTKKGKSHSIKAKKASNLHKNSKVTGKTCKGKKPKAKVVVVPLRRSARKSKVVSLQNKKIDAKKRKKSKSSAKKKQPQSGDNTEQPKPKRGRGRPRKPKKVKRKRTQMYSSYWLNGLFLSKKPDDDDRIMPFRSKNHLVPFQQLTSISGQPKCSLCHEPEFRSLLNYINCQTCGDWFHGDAFGLKDEHIEIVIGFKCHKCRNRTPPICPHFHALSDELKSKNDDEVSNEVLKRPKSDPVEELKGVVSEGDCAADAQNGPECAIVEQSSGAIHISDKI